MFCSFSEFQIISQKCRELAPNPFPPTHPPFTPLLNLLRLNNLSAIGIYTEELILLILNLNIWRFYSQKLS